MKIVCDSCGAKYSIADEKVAGKVFKIRCKKCSAIIMVRGDQLDQGPLAGDEGPPAAEPDYPADAIWHVVVNGEQQGPYTPGQIAELMNAGSFDWDGYVWREGFEGWLVARDVGELVEAVSGPQAQQSQPDASPFAQGGMPEPGLGQSNGHDPYGGPAGADPFGAPAAGDPFGAPAGDPFGASAADPDPGGLGYGGGMDSGGGGGGADLFAQTGPSPFEGGGDVVASSAAPGALSGEQAMTGQRNENSVLFSLQNLQALAGAADSPAGGPSPGIRATPGAGGNLGQATGEGSGLIDIRALAGATGVVGGEPSLGGGPRAPESVDNLMSIGTGSPLNSALGAPVLAPVQEEKNNRGLIIAMVSAAGLLAVAAIVIAVVLVTKEPEPVAQASGVPGSVAGLAPTPGTPAPPTSAGSAPAADTLGGGTADPDPAASAAGSDSPSAGSTSRTGGRGQAGRRRDRAARQARGGAAPTMAASPTPAPSSASSMASRSRGGSGSIDDLLNAALGGGGGGGMSRAAAAPMGGGSAGGSANLPDTPPRDAVLRALRSVQNAVSACGRGQHGVATTAITVSGTTGRVSSAQVKGQFAGTPIGSCVARAVRGARFPRFKRATFNVSFPYRI